MPSFKKEPPGALAARTIPSLVARGFPPTRACSGYRVAPTRAIRIAVHPGSRSISGSLGEVHRHAAGEHPQAAEAASLSLQCKSVKPTPIRPTITTAITAKKVHRR
jgi:hypothetical protein